MTVPTITFADNATGAANVHPGSGPALASGITTQQLLALLGNVQPQAAAPATPAAPTAWGALASARVSPAAPPPPVGVALPIRLELPDGSSVKPLLLFGPEFADPGILRQLLESLLGAGVPLDVWRPKQDDGGRGGYGQRRGGWR